jgi:hypothetical protein
MPVVPQSNSKGYPGFVYLAWHSKLAGQRVIRTVGQAKADSGLNLGNSFCYVTQCRGGEQSGPKRTSESGYRIVAMPGLDAFLKQLTSKHVADTLGIPERQVLSWKPESGATRVGTVEPASPPAARRRARAQRPAEAPEASPASRKAETAPLAGLSAEKLEDLLHGSLQPVLATLSVLEQGQRQLREQLEKLERTAAPVPQARSVFSQERGAPKLEEALVTMLGMLRDLPEKLVGEQTEKLNETLRSEGKHTGRGLRGLREALEFQHREITSILAKVADSLTRVVSARDANLQVLINTLHSALSLVPELPEDHPLNLPSVLPAPSSPAEQDRELEPPIATDNRSGSE